MDKEDSDDPVRIATDPRTFEIFYRKNFEGIQKFVARRVDDPHLAADITADIFLQFIDSAHTYRSRRGPATSWLFGIARNVVANSFRRQYREREINQRVSGRRLLSEEDVSRLEERIDAESQARQLYQAMSGLSEKERAVLELTALEDMSPQEVAKTLGLPPVTVRVRLHRARRIMREQLDDSQGPAISQSLCPSEVS